MAHRAKECSGKNLAISDQNRVHIWQKSGPVVPNRAKSDKIEQNQAKSGKIGQMNLASGSGVSVQVLASSPELQSGMLAYEHLFARIIELDWNGWPAEPRGAAAPGCDAAASPPPAAGATVAADHVRSQRAPQFRLRRLRRLRTVGRFVRHVVREQLPRHAILQKAN